MIGKKASRSKDVEPQKENNIQILLDLCVYIKRALFVYNFTSLTQFSPSRQTAKQTDTTVTELLSVHFSCAEPGLHT